MKVEVEVREKVLGVVNGVLKESPTDTFGKASADWTLIVEKAKAVGLAEELVWEAMDDLLDLGAVYEPILGRFALAVPPA